MYRCPKPNRWNEVYQALLKQTHLEWSSPDAPPMPLILAGWWASSSRERHNRWLATVAWASEHGAAELTEIAAGEFEEWDHDDGGDLARHHFTGRNPAALPLPGERRRAEHLLRRNWLSVAGNDVAKVTRPLRLTGKKARRLLVEADKRATPPWGTWTSLENRAPFHALRMAVNRAIEPLGVDHIDFVVLESNHPRGFPSRDHLLSVALADAEVLLSNNEWITRSSIRLRVFYLGLCVALQRVASKSEVSEVLTKIMADTLSVRVGDDPFRATAVSKAIEQAHARLDEQYCRRATGEPMPDERTQAVREALSSVEQALEQWVRVVAGTQEELGRLGPEGITSHPSEALRLLNAIGAGLRSLFSPVSPE